MNFPNNITLLEESAEKKSSEDFAREYIYDIIWDGQSAFTA